MSAPLSDPLVLRSHIGAEVEVVGCAKGEESSVHSGIVVSVDPVSKR